MQLRSVGVVLGFAVISQGATCHPPIVAAGTYLPVAPAMRPAGSVRVSAVGGGGLGAMGPRFEESSGLSAGLSGGAGRVELQPTDGVALALAGGVIAPIGSAGDLPFPGSAHGMLEARFRVARLHVAWLNVGGGAQSWVQLGKPSMCATSVCSSAETPRANVLSPIGTLNAGFGATWISSSIADWYSNFSLGFTYGSAFVVSGPAAAPTVQAITDFTGSLLVSTGVRITLWSDRRSPVRWSLLLDGAVLGRTEPLIAGIFAIGTSVEIDRVVAVRDDGVRRLERD